MKSILFQEKTENGKLIIEQSIIQFMMIFEIKAKLMDRDYKIRYNSAILMSKLDEVIIFAKKAHEGQVDKAGRPYFKHVQAVDRFVCNLIDSWNEEYDDFLVEARIPVFRS